jgi:hypothetical protein
MRLSRGFPVAPVFIFFSCGEDFLRSSLGPGWLKLPIFDCRLPRRGGVMEIGRSRHTTFSIGNQQSAMKTLWRAGDWGTVSPVLSGAVCAR